MAQASPEQLDLVREAVKQLVSPDQLKKFDDDDFQLLWREKYRDVDDLRSASREDLLAVKLPGALVAYLKPAQGMEVTPGFPYTCALSKPHPAWCRPV